MFRTILQYLRAYDWVLFATTIILVSLGLATIYSIGANREPQDFANFGKQLLFAGVGLAVLFGVSFLDFRTLFARPWIYYLLGLLLLGAVLVFGQEIRGTRGWFALGTFTLQPVELVKILLIISLAQYLSKHSEAMASWPVLLRAAGLVLLFMFLVLLQPDVGSAIVILAIFLAFLLLTRLPLRRMAVILLMLLLVGAASWFFVLQSYQKDRILTFLDPGRDPFGRGYHVTQSIIAVGSGELVGRGLGLGPQSQLNFLPAQETDFIFAVIAEELGFVGVTLLLGAFAVLFLRIGRIIRRSGGTFEFFLVSGLFIYFAVQTFINIGMNLGLLPVAGIPLSFVSYGGSSLLTSLLAIGIIESVALRRRLA